MRISTHQAFLTGLQGILDGQANVTRLQEQVATGKRVGTPADDPIASSQIIALNRQIALLDQYQSNSDTAINRLNVEESALDSVADVLQRVRELTVQAGNDVLDQQGRTAIATELQQRVEELMGLVNTRGVDNEYLFSGYQANTQAFVRNAGGGFSYQGDDGQLFVPVALDLNVAANDSGYDVFVDIPAPNDFTSVAAPANAGSGVVQTEVITDQAAYDSFYPDDAVITFTVAGPNTTFSVTRASDGSPINGGSPLQPLTNVSYTAGEAITFEGMHIEIGGAPVNGDVFTAVHDAPRKQDMLTTVENLALGLVALGNTPADKLARQELISDSLIGLDNALASVSHTRAKVGARLNTIENAQQLNDDLKLISQQTLSNTQDLDYNEAISLLTQSTFILQAAQQSYVSINNLSLFNFIR